MTEQQIKLFHEIIVERKRQNGLHPVFPSNQAEQLAILMEEVGEVFQAHNDKEPEEMRKELVEAASVIFRMLEGWETE